MTRSPQELAASAHAEAQRAQTRIDRPFPPDRLADMYREVERLAALPVERIREERGIHPDRAPVIVAGALVVRETLAHLGLGELEASEHDIMHGAALAAAELPEPVEGDAPPGAYTCC